MRRPFVSVRGDDIVTALRNVFCAHRIARHKQFRKRELGATNVSVARLSGDRISLTTLYRIIRADGQAPTFESKLLDAVRDVLGIGPEELLERDTPRQKRRR